MRLGGRQVFACVVLDLTGSGGKRVAGTGGARASSAASSSFYGSKAKDLTQKWFVVDPLLLLVAVPEKSSLNHGKLLSVLPLLNTVANVDRRSRRHLVLQCAVASSPPSESGAAAANCPPPGLMEQVPFLALPRALALQLVPGTRRDPGPGALAQAAQAAKASAAAAAAAVHGGPGAAAAAAVAAAVSSSSSFSSSLASPTTQGQQSGVCWWRMVVLFETEAMCMHACEHVNSRRQALRNARRDRLLRAFLEAPVAV